MPLVNRTFSQLIDFTRTTSATYVNSAGLIATTPASVNLLTYTQEFDNAAWTKTQATVTANTTVAPDGTNTADALVDTAVSNIHYAYQASGTALSNGMVVTMSVYAKASTLNYVTVGLTDISVGNVYAVAVFNLSNGTLATSGASGTGYAVNSTSITSVGNGWYRCSVVCTVGSSVTFVRGAVGINKTGIISAGAGGMETYLGNGSGIYVWGAQLEVGSTATDYTRNYGGLYPPRFDYDPVTLAPRGLLIEEQRTNLLTYSAQFDNAAWAKTASTVTADAVVSPDGGTNADKLVESATTGAHAVGNSAGTVTATETLSVYAKPAGRTWLALQMGANVVVYYDIQNGVLGSVSGGTATITAVGNGWYRCTATGVRVTNTNNLIFSASANNTFSYTGDGTSGVYIWGAQLEAGAFATSYIPTVASQVTRTADIATIQAPNFASWYNQTAGTFVAEFTATTLNASGTTVYNAVSADAGAGTNQISLYTYSNFAAGRVVTGGVVQADINGGGSPANNAVIKSGIAYAANNVAVTVNGATPGTDTSVTLPTVDRLPIGSQTGGNYLNGWVRSIRYYPTKLSNAQLQALTA